MRLRIGYELQYEFPQPTPLILMLNVHFTRVSDLEIPDHIVLKPSVPISGYRDSFGNWCSRLVAPAGRMIISADSMIRDGGLTDPVVSGNVLFDKYHIMGHLSRRQQKVKFKKRHV